MTRLVVALSLAACAHTADLGLRPSAPIPGATSEVIATRDGTQLVVLRWAATTTQRGTLVLVHGLKDYAARYAAFASELTARGYAVIAFDLRGHAHSTGRRVAPAAWRDYVADAVQVIGLAGAQPVFVFGHSMGGAIATLAALETKPAGLILSAPALAVDASPLLVAFTQLAGVLTPGAKALDLPNAEFSSDPAAGKAMDRDPLIEQSPSPARTAAGLLSAIREIWARSDELTLPLLALHGTRDSITAPSGSRELVRAAASSDKTLRLYDNAFHDLLHEPQHGAKVTADILAWLDAHTGGDPVIAPPLSVARLRGEPSGWTQALSLAGGVSSDAAFAGLISVQLGKARPLGWHGGVTAQLIGEHRALSVRPLGIQARLGAAALGVSGGASVITGANIAVSFATYAELPLGIAHVSLLAERQRGITNTNDHGPLASDLLLTAVTLRYGADRRYWPGARAGVGPAITAGIDWVGSSAADWFITLGLQLYGAD